MTDASTYSRTVFGVGCIYFGYSDDIAAQAQLSDRAAFIADMKKRLEGVESLSSVTLHGADDSSYFSLMDVSVGDSEVCVPLPQGGFRLEFDLYLPFRVQEGVHESCDVESVHVDLLYGYEMPILVISYEWPNEEGDAQPSSAVVVVRKYLEQKLSDGIFKCGCVGPSPFHADFTLIETDLDEGVRLVDMSNNRIGYGSIEFQVPRNMSLITAFYTADLDSIFSKFYHLSELRSRVIDARATIVNSSRELLEQGVPSNLRERLKMFRNQPETVDSLNSEVFREVLLRLDMGNAIAEGERTEIVGVNSPLDRFFSEYKSISLEDGWSKFADVANFFEERRQKAIGNITAIAAGIVGGVFGAVIGSTATVLLTSEMDSNPLKISESPAFQERPTGGKINNENQDRKPLR